MEGGGASRSPAGLHGFSLPPDDGVLNRSPRNRHYLSVWSLHYVEGTRERAGPAARGREGGGDARAADSPRSRDTGTGAAYREVASMGSSGTVFPTATTVWVALRLRKPLGPTPEARDYACDVHRARR